MAELNELCRDCTNDCFQAETVKIIRCRKYPNGAPKNGSKIPPKTSLDQRRDTNGLKTGKSKGNSENGA